VPIGARPFWARLQSPPGFAGKIPRDTSGGPGGELGPARRELKDFGPRCWFFPCSTLCLGDCSLGRVAFLRVTISRFRREAWGGHQQGDLALTSGFDGLDIERKKRQSKNHGRVLKIGRRGRVFGGKAPNAVFLPASPACSRSSLGGPKGKIRSFLNGQDSVVSGENQKKIWVGERTNS